MNAEQLLASWLAEEEIAHIHGWDFSHIRGRYTEQQRLAWQFETIVRTLLTPQTRLLDMDTGGGEFLLSLNHPYALTAATENYLPNVQLCKEKLLSLGIDFKQADAGGQLPFSDGSFDLVVNRHGDFNPQEIFRVLKPGGLFATQQVGAENDRELVTLLMGEQSLPFPEQYLEKVKSAFAQAGFDILRAQEAFGPIRFFDIGALVWFARVIPWEFPGFSVRTHLDALYRAQEILEKEGEIVGRTHRFLLIARKPC